MRVNVQLIKAATDTHLWADTFDRKLTDVFARRKRNRKNDRGHFAGEAYRSEEHAIAARPTENTEAYQLYLKGRFFWNKRTGDDLRRRSITSIKRWRRIRITRWLMPE